MQINNRRLLILIPRMGGGGAERVVSIIANNLCVVYDIQITTLVSNESFYLLDKRIKFTSACYKINRKSKITRAFNIGKNFINSVFYVRSEIKKFNPQIILVLLEEMDIVSFLATRGLNGFKIINSERNDPTRRNRFYQYILQFIYKHTDFLVCQSSTVLNFYKMVPANKKIVIPNPIDFSIYPNKVEESYPLKIVTVGRLVKQKNMTLLIKAFAEVANKQQDVKLIIYGEGPERNKLEECIKCSGLNGKAFLLGSERDVLNKIKDAAIFAFPSDFEGFPNALIEAIALGIPVITTDFATGIAKEIVTEEFGIVVPCGDVNRFANALEELITNGYRREKMRKGDRFALDKFNVSRVVSAWKSLFHNLTS